MLTSFRYYVVAKPVMPPRGWEWVETPSPIHRFLSYEARTEEEARSAAWGSAPSGYVTDRVVPADNSTTLNDERKA